MSPRWVGFIVFVAILMASVGAMAQGSILELNTAYNSTLDPNLNTVSSYAVSWQDNPWGTLVNPIAHAEFFTALFTLLVGQQNLYAVFPEASAWLWIWFIMWLPIIATVVFGILMLFFAILQRVIA